MSRAPACAWCFIAPASGWHGHQLAAPQMLVAHWAAQFRVSAIFCLAFYQGGMLVKVTPAS